jgi:hypothetical protein
MGSADKSGEGHDFVEFRRKVRAAEVRASASGREGEAQKVCGRAVVVVQNGQVLQSGYQEGFFNQRGAESKLAGGAAQP